MPVRQHGTDHFSSSGPDDLASLCTALAMPVRLQILLILRKGERSVTALMEELTPRMPQPTVSHHLGLLRDAGLVRPRRAGKHMLYSLQEPTVAAGPDGTGVTVTVGNCRVHFTVPTRQPTNHRPN